MSPCLGSSASAPWFTPVRVGRGKRVGTRRCRNPIVHPISCGEGFFTGCLNHDCSGGLGSSVNERWPCQPSLGLLLPGVFGWKGTMKTLSFFPSHRLSLRGLGPDSLCH